MELFEKIFLPIWISIFLYPFEKYFMFSNWLFELEDPTMGDLLIFIGAVAVGVGGFFFASKQTKILGRQGKIAEQQNDIIDEQNCIIEKQNEIAMNQLMPILKWGDNINRRREGNKIVYSEDSGKIFFSVMNEGVGTAFELRHNGKSPGFNLPIGVGFFGAIEISVTDNQDKVRFYLEYNDFMGRVFVSSFSMVRLSNRKEWVVSDFDYNLKS